jgi:nucleoside recognition membrane protein YjiH
MNLTYDADTVRNRSMSSGVSFDSNKFMRAGIMQLIDPANHNNIRFTAEFESAVEGSITTESNELSDAFKIAALAYASKVGVKLTQTEINYAYDLYMGINPWTKAIP